MACKTCVKDTAEEHIKRMRIGKETLCEHLYHMPQKIETTHNNFVESLDKGTWGFILVRGDNGAGKSRYMKTIESIARDKGYCVAHLELMGDELREYGIPGFIVHQSLHKLRLPDGYQFLPKIEMDGGFKKKVHDALEHDRTLLEFWSTTLTNILLHLTSHDIASDKKGLVTEWLKGSKLYVKDLRYLDIYNQRMKSFLDVPVKETLYFVKQLCQSLGYKGLFITADEIEKGGELTPNKGRVFLDSLRDAINILLDTESIPDRIAVQKGLFVCFAISLPYLFHAGLISTEDLKLRGIERPSDRPKTTIDLSPRLHTILENCASTIDVDIDSVGDLAEILEKIIPCYNRATNNSKSVDARKLAENTLRRAGGYLPRPNIQLAVQYLDGKWDLE